MIGFRFFHMAALGHTGSLGTKLDYRDTDNGLGHGVCIHMFSVPIPPAWQKVDIIMPGTDNGFSQEDQQWILLLTGHFGCLG